MGEDEGAVIAIGDCRFQSEILPLQPMWSVKSEAISCIALEEECWNAYRVEKGSGCRRVGNR
jgi:hypothetical protein